MSNTFFLNTPFGDFDLHIEENCSDKEQAAIEELKENLESSNCGQAYRDDDNNVYAVLVSFYYGSHYVELDEPVEDENEATIIASNQLISELENHF